MSDRTCLIFINYRGSDQHWATEFVYARLTETFGADAVFKAGNAIRAGEAFPSILERQAASCPVMLACIGPGWLTAGEAEGARSLDSPDDWVRREIAISLRAGNQVVPLLIGNQDEVMIPAANHVPEEIRDMVYRQSWRLVPGGGLDVTVPKLVDRLAELVPALADRRTATGRGSDATQPAPDDAATTHNTSRDSHYFQENVARDHATINAIQHGDLHIYPADRRAEQ